VVVVTEATARAAAVTVGAAVGAAREAAARVEGKEVA
jgi:hypothetical protein